MPLRLLSRPPKALFLKWIFFPKALHFWFSINPFLVLSSLSVNDTWGLALETLFPTNWNRIPSQTHSCIAACFMWLEEVRPLDGCPASAEAPWLTVGLCPLKEKSSKLNFFQCVEYTNCHSSAGQRTAERPFTLRTAWLPWGLQGDDYRCCKPGKGSEFKVRIAFSLLWNEEWIRQIILSLGPSGQFAHTMHEFCHALCSMPDRQSVLLSRLCPLQSQVSFL